MKKRYILILVFLIVFILAINYRYLDERVSKLLKNRELVYVDRVIDGDTIESNGESIRLLGINCPEKGQDYYGEAKQYLEERVLNKNVFLEYGKERKDKYGRVLGYIFIGEENINIELVREGYANYYFPSGKDVYYYSLVDAWKECIGNNKNLCEKSKDACADCIEMSYSSGKVRLDNVCYFSCSLEAWTLKGEGRDIFEVHDGDIEVGEQDTLFLRDGNNKLVLWESY
jgi:micrococcal nuclease